MEWQADFYASCLLMPRKLVIAAWDEMSGSASRASFSLRRRIDHIRDVERTLMTSSRAARLDPSIRDRDDEALEHFARALCRTVPRLTDRHAHPA